MPKRNLLLLTLITAISLVAWLARDHDQRGRHVGEVLTVIERASLEPPAAAELETAALEAIVARLDEHSALVDGTARRDLEATLDQQFGGVGLELVAHDGGIVVHAPIVGGPAWRAGVLAGDRIVAINGQSVSGMSVRDAVALLRGDVGSNVFLGVLSPGPIPPGVVSPDPAGGPPPDGGVDGVDLLVAPREVNIVREIVRTESVLGDRRLPDGTWDWRIEGEKGVALVRITGFGERTAAELDAALASISALPGLRGLVIDLRGNPGGLLTAAVEVCDRFLDGGLIVSTRRRGAGATDTVDARHATDGQLLRGVPIAVVIDGLTASAAEIVAACLQDHGRAAVVGSRSFGKGTVQSIIPLSDGRRLLKLTTAEYRRPADAGIERRRGEAAWCVCPDEGRQIDLTAQAREAVATWRRRRDLPPAAGLAADNSAADLPRRVDPALAVALAALPDLGGKKEAAGHADEAAGAGEESSPDDGRGG